MLPRLLAQILLSGTVKIWERNITPEGRCISDRNGREVSTVILFPSCTLIMGGKMSHCMTEGSMQQKTAEMTTPAAPSSALSHIPCYVVKVVSQTDYETMWRICKIPVWKQKIQALQNNMWSPLAPSMSILHVVEEGNCLFFC